jgi:hypothetical protein
VAKVSAPCSPFTVTLIKNSLDALLEFRQMKAKLLIDFCRARTAQQKKSTNEWKSTQPVGKKEVEGK